MKAMRVTLLAIVLILSVLPVTALTQDGLVAYWSFDDGTASDQSGNGNNGIVYGVTMADGVSGKCMSFDGLDDYINIGANFPSLGGSQPFTIISWVKNFRTTEGIPLQYIMTRYRHYYQGEFFTDINQSHFGFLREVSPFSLGSSFPISPFEWTQVVAVFDGTNKSIFINGKLSNSAVSGSSASAPNVPVLIGAGLDQNSNTVNHYEGLLDEIRVYTRALADYEILELYNSIQPSTFCTGSDAVFCDDFEDGNADGWRGWPSSNWTANEGVYNVFLDTPESISWRLAGNVDWGDMELSFDFNNIEGVEKLVYLRWGVGGTNGYLVFIRSNYGSFNQSDIKIAKYIDNTQVETVIYPFVTQSNTLYHVDMSLIGNTITCRIDGADAFTYTDSENLYPVGRFGFAANKPAGVGQSHVQFDNVQVRCVEGATCVPFANASGTVLDAETSSPLEEVLVELLQNTSVRYTATTDVNGYYEFAGIDAGDYVVIYSQSGYISQTSLVSLTENQNNGLPTVNLVAIQCPTAILDWGSPISTGVAGGAPSIGPNGDIMYFARHVGSTRDIFYSTWDEATEVALEAVQPRSCWV